MGCNAGGKGRGRMVWEEPWQGEGWQQASWASERQGQRLSSSRQQRGRHSSCQPRHGNLVLDSGDGLVRDRRGGDWQRR